MRMKRDGRMRMDRKREKTDSITRRVAHGIHSVTTTVMSE